MCTEGTQSSLSDLILYESHEAPAVPVDDVESTGAYALSLSAPTIRKSINHLVDLGLLEEITGKERDRLFAYREYLDTRARGTEPL